MAKLYRSMRPITTPPACKNRRYARTNCKQLTPLRLVTRGNNSKLVQDRRMLIVRVGLSLLWLTTGYCQTPADRFWFPDRHRYIENNEALTTLPTDLFQRLPGLLRL